MQVPDRSEKCTSPHCSTDAGLGAQQDRLDCDTLVRRSLELSELPFRTLEQVVLVP